jgi:hypothetical protein
VSEEHKTGNGAAAIRETLDKDAIDLQPAAQPNALDEVDVAALKVRYRDLTADLDRLAEMKRKADAGTLGYAVFEAERFALAEKYKKKGMTPAKALDEVALRLRPPMGCRRGPGEVGRGQSPARRDIAARADRRAVARSRPRGLRDDRARGAA